MADEPFQFDADNRSASIRSFHSTSEGNTAAMIEPSHGLVNLTASTHNWIRDGNMPSVLAPVVYSKDQNQSIHSHKSERAFSPTMDPDLSMTSSVSSSLNSTTAAARAVLMNPPAYVESGSSSTVSPISYSIPAMQKSRGRSGRRVKPVVYSAIGSLESVNQNSLGSFNHRLAMATTLKRVKEKKVKLDATTTRISKRIVQSHTESSEQSEYGMNGLASTTNHRSSNVSQKISNLSTTLNADPPPSESRDTLVSTQDPLITGGKEVTATCSSAASSNLKQDGIVSIIKKEHKGASQEHKSKKRNVGKKKKVTIDSKPKELKRIELFRPSCDAYTPRMGKKEIKYKPAEQRVNMEGTVGSALGTIQKPNFNDALKRVAMIIQQHIVKIERRFETSNVDNLKLFDPAMRDAFAEVNFVSPRYKCTIVKLPMARAGVVCGMRKIRIDERIPTADDIYDFGHRLFKQVQLSSECSIICLIYVERLMEIAKVPVMATTWKPIFMCGLLLASKVWQDWSSWNIEFANVYPQFSLESINRLELQFLKMVKWDLYISSSLYAKYYFALRSLLEKQDFRRRYATMVGGANQVSASQAVKISKRTELLKEKSLAFLSKSV